MANIKSQKKRILTNEKARLRNKAVRSEVRTYVKAFEEIVASGDANAVEAARRKAAQSLDRAVSKGVLHSRGAANRKASMARSVSRRVAKT